MSDREYEIIDELYFTVSFEQVQQQLTTPKELLLEELLGLVKKGWVRAMEPITEQDAVSEAQIREKYDSLLFLATKKGLMVHNSR